MSKFVPFLREAADTLLLGLMIFLLLFAMIGGCGGKDEGGPDTTEGEAEAEGEGDPQCPGFNTESESRGCKTDTACAAVSDCPDDDPCKEYFCSQATATCRYFFLDRDEDGYLPPGCGGRDCDDQKDYIRPGAPEQCNGEDNDCDGEVDNFTGACFSDLGECTAGMRSCSNGQWSECVGGVGPTSELCDGLDNDCDGMVDEGGGLFSEDPLTQECGSSVGRCEPGMRTCENGSWSECEGGVGPSTEVCNGEDDDCDGIDDTVDVLCCRWDVKGWVIDCT